MVNAKSHSVSALPCAPDALDEFLARPSARVVAALRHVPGPFLVLGAGGKLGLHLCLMLRQALAQLGREDRIVAVSRFRSLHDRGDFLRFGIETLACDLEREAELKTLPDAPTVFFLAGVKFGTANSPELLQRMNVQMPRRVAARFRDAVFVAFSTGCVYPFVGTASGGATEETPPAPNGDYAASCLKRETAFADAGLRYGTKSVLIRLNYAVEFRYGLLVDLALKILRGEPVDVTTGYANVIWQTDALGYAIQALQLASAYAPPLNVTGPETLPVRHLALRLGGLVGQPVRFVGEEADTAWLNNAARAHRLFGAPAVAPETMLDWIAAWLGSGGEVWGKPTGFERRDGNF